MSKNNEYRMMRAREGEVLTDRKLMSAVERRRSGSLKLGVIAACVVPL